jgi:hypothetical protein
MTDLTARQLLDTIRKSLDETSKRFTRAEVRKVGDTARVKPINRKSGTAKKLSSALAAHGKRR